MRLWAELTALATRPDHPAHEYFVDRYQTARTMTGQALRNRLDEGHLREGVDPHHAAALLAAVLDGLQLQWLLDPACPIGDHLEHFLGLLLHTSTPSAQSQTENQAEDQTKQQTENQTEKP